MSTSIHHDQFDKIESEMTDAGKITFASSSYKPKPVVDYKYNEGKLLQEITDYINGTYNEHYAQGKIQSTEIAIDRGRGTGFCMGNVDKYSQRYGRKGDTPAEWRKDLMKVIHYAIIQLYIHDQEYKD